MMNTHTNRTRVVLAALAGAAVALAAVAVPAAAGIGDVFRLGQTNSANATSLLTGTNAGPQLKVVNLNGEYAGIRADSAGGSGSAILGYHNSAAGPGAAVFGQSDSTAASASAIYGVVSSSSAGSGSAALRGENNGTTFPGFGVYGSTAGGGYGVYGKSNTGDGVYGVSNTGIGVYGSGGFGGFFVGSGSPGVFAFSGGEDAIRARTLAANKSALFARHDGPNFGYGLYAQSEVGPAIGMSGPDTGQAPITLNGKPFPSATAGYNDNSVLIPNDGIWHFVSSLNVGPGVYVIIAKANVEDVVESGESRVRCRLSAGGDYDQVWSRPAGADWESLSFTVFHSFAAADAVNLNCFAASGYHSASVWSRKIMAIRVAGGTNTFMP
jgi:hypothetical protein